MSRFISTNLDQNNHSANTCCQTDWVTEGISDGDDLQIHRTEMANSNAALGRSKPQSCLRSIPGVASGLVLFVSSFPNRACLLQIVTAPWAGASVSLNVNKYSECGVEPRCVTVVWPSLHLPMLGKGGICRDVGDQVFLRQNLISGISTSFLGSPVVPPYPRFCFSWF